MYFMSLLRLSNRVARKVDKLRSFLCEAWREKKLMINKFGYYSNTKRKGRVGELSETIYKEID